MLPAWFSISKINQKLICRQQKKLMRVLSKIDNSVEENDDKSNHPPSSKPVKATHPLNNMVNQSSKVSYLSHLVPRPPFFKYL